MSTVTLIGIDLGKHSFHLHGQDAVRQDDVSQEVLAPGSVQVTGQHTAQHSGDGGLRRRALDGAPHRRTGPPGQAHFPQFVRPFVQGNKNDFADAQAICEAASRPSMRFVSVRNQAQQTVSALHRVRESLVAQRTGVINQVHAFLLEFGISLPRGQAILRRLPAVLAEHALPPQLGALLERLRSHFQYLDEQVGQIERELCLQLREDERSQRLLQIPGIGPITASVLMTELGDARQFGSARQFAASVGLVPRQYSTGGKPTLLGISKRGDKNLRRLLVQGARAIMRHVERRTDRLGAWVRELQARRHSNVVACALANKLARIAWAILANGTNYRSEQTVAPA